MANQANAGNGGQPSAGTQGGGLFDL